MEADFDARIAALQPEGAYHMLQRAQQLEAAGKHIIHLEVGQPDIPTYTHIREAGREAIEAGHTRYTPVAGMPVLRQAIAEDASRRLNIPVLAEQVVVGPGSKPFLFFATLALVRPGDEVIYPDPGFPTYRAMIGVAGGIPKPVPLCEEQDFSFDLDAFDRLLSPRTRLIVLNSPGNPTGGVLSREALEHIAAAALRLNAWVLSDEIYSRLVYAPPALSIASLPGMAERTIVCDGFSKTYAMTGWRLGYGVMPPALAERVELLLTHSVGCTAGFTQVAGLAALQASQQPVAATLENYRKRRDVMVNGLNALPGISCRMPAGAFYAFANVKSFNRPATWLADYLLQEAGVALLPGDSFGTNGEGYLRLCFANSLENITAALECITQALARL
jgi:aspartate/methionine/tyrosine aminotransferase